jgi:hypothetical protein
MALHSSASLARLDKLKLIPQIAGVCHCITIPPYSLHAATIQKLNAES